MSESLPGNYRSKLSHLRLLILSPTSSTSSPSLFPPLLHALTGTLPPPLLSQGGGSFAGYTSHPPVQLRTKYFEIDVSIWCDEVPLPSPGNVGGDQGEVFAIAPRKEGDDAELEEPATLASWKEQMLSPAASEVRGAIGGIIVALPYNPTVFEPRAQATPEVISKRSSALDGYIELLETMNELRESIEDEKFDREIATVVMVQSTGSTGQYQVTRRDVDTAAERVEDELVERRGIFGWEVIGWDAFVTEEADVVNGNSELVTESPWGSEETGEERNGIRKVVEALELVDWGAATGADGDVDDDGLVPGLLDDDDEFPGLIRIGAEDGIGMQSHELESEIMGLKLAMREQEGDRSSSNLDDGLKEDESHEAVQVEQLQGLMERVVAIREAGSEMGKEKRERFAQREIARIMKEMG